MKNKRIIDHINCDAHNIQELVNLLNTDLTKGEYRSIVASIKVLVKDIKYQKVLIKDNLDNCINKNYLPLFEVLEQEIEIDYLELDSFFGPIT